MPVVNLSPIARRQYLDSNGDPVVGGLLFYYAAGSSTKQSTYTDSSGTVANSNPIVLDASGRTPQGVWFEAGLLYKEVLALATDTDPPTSPIYTADGLEGVNDTTTPAALASSSQWVATGLTPTYVSATQFTLVGDQTAAFHVGRRMRFTVTAGTVYGRISVSAFGALTTITVVLDSGVLDAGLSAVDVGILTALNNSLPEPSSVGFQPLDAELTAISGLVSAADTVPSFTGSGTAALITLGTASGNIPKVGTKSATEALAGLVELATQAEAEAGTDDTVAMTALKTAQAIAASVNRSGTLADATHGGANDLTAVDFTGLPAGTKKVTLLFETISINNTDQVLVQIGDSGGIENTSYVGAGCRLAGGLSAESSFTTGFGLMGNAATYIYQGSIELCLIDAATNKWEASGVLASAAGATLFFTAGTKALSGELTQLRVTTTGTGTFDSGNLNIIY